MDYLGEGVLTGILLRLPAKSLLRFKCVSRLWHSIISDPEFAEAQLRMSLQGNPNPSEKVLVPRHHVDSLDGSIFTTLSNPPINPEEYLTVEGSCHGLLCLQSDRLNFSVYNPTTRELRQLPECSSLGRPGDEDAVCGFGYDTLKDDYKLLVRCMYRSEPTQIAVIYSLRSNSWRSIADVNDYHLYDAGMYSNGFLHWVSAQGDTIVSFDVAAEEFREGLLAMPPFRLQHGSVHLSVTAEGTLVAYRTKLGKSEVWIMKDRGLNSTWTALCCFVNEPPWGGGIFPLIKDGKTLLCVRRGCYSLDVYDPKDGSWNTFRFSSYRFGMITTYVESLVSVHMATA